MRTTGARFCPHKKRTLSAVLLAAAVLLVLLPCASNAGVTRRLSGASGAVGAAKPVPAPVSAKTSSPATAKDGVLRQGDMFYHIALIGTAVFGGSVAVSVAMALIVSTVLKGYWSTGNSPNAAGTGTAVCTNTCSVDTRRDASTDTRDNDGSDSLGVAPAVKRQQENEKLNNDDDVAKQDDDVVSLTMQLAVLGSTVDKQRKKEKEQTAIIAQERRELAAALARVAALEAEIAASRTRSQRVGTPANAKQHSDHEVEQQQPTTDAAPTKGTSAVLTNA
eukprot:m51a1_g3218 hypothetical protein (278) ;mRNA; f:50104-51266